MSFYIVADCFFPGPRAGPIMGFMVSSIVVQYTDLLRTSDYDLWSRLRVLLKDQRLDPDRTIVVELLQEGPDHEDEQVTFDEDFVFYGAPENPGGTVHLLTNGPAEQTITVDVASLPPSSHRVVIAAAIDGGLSFGDVGAVQVATAPGDSAAPLTRATLDAATSERTLVLAELYRRGPLWRFRAVGQGYDHGLDALARGYGVDIAD
jgi:stress response protein SCP2